METRRRGPTTLYGSKKGEPNITLCFTSRAKTLLGQAARRLSRSSRTTRSEIVEYLVRRHAADLCAADIGAWKPKTRPNTCVTLTGGAKAILAVAVGLTGRAKGDIVEELIRRHAADLRIADMVADPVGNREPVQAGVGGNL